MALQNLPLLSESCVNLIIGQLKANFNSMLADSDNQYNDGINLEPIDETSFYISYRFQTVRPPAIYVLMENHVLQYTDRQNYLESHDRCLVVLSCEDIDGDTLTRKAMRYGRALFGSLNLVELVTLDQRLKMQVIPQQLDYLQPVTDKLQEKQKKFRMDVVLTLKLLHFEKNLT